MAEKSFFDQYIERWKSTGLRKRFSDASVKWFKNAVKDAKISRNKLLADPAIKTRNISAVSRSMIGRMFTYYYDPKHKKTLPYYDRFPLILMVGPAEGGFYGINLHYLSPVVRAKFFSHLLELANNKKMNSSTRLLLTYKLLASSSKYRAFKPAFKHYLTKNVISKIGEINANEWEIAVWLPTEDFRKKSKTAVWSDSLKMI